MIGGFKNPILTGATAVSMNVDFIASTQTPDFGATVSFTNLSSPTPLFNFWDFGDGTTSMDANPIKLYEDIGTYSVTLNACDNVSGGIETKNDYIFVEAPVLIFFTDFFGIPETGYSLRKLSPNSVYSGPCIEVRRSSDNTTENIGFDANGDLDTTALLSFVGAGNNGFVKTWYDQSGNNRHLFNFTGGGTNQSNDRQPSIVSSGNLITHNNKVTIDFPNYHFLSYDEPILPNDWIFTVAKCNNTSTLNSLISLAPNSLRVDRGGNVRRQSNQYRAPGLTGWDFNDYTRSNDANGLHYFNGVIHNTSHNLFNQHFNSLKRGTGGAIDNLGLTIGSAFTGSRNWRGFISEVIIYGGDKTSQRVDIETNINDYYSII